MLQNKSFNSGHPNFSVWKNQQLGEFFSSTKCPPDDTFSNTQDDMIRHINKSIDGFD